MSNNNESFSYTYSAKQQEEVKKIRDKYITRDENKMETLRRLDNSVEQRGIIVSLAVGVVSSLLFGTGMACIIEWTDLFILGIVVGIIGIIGMVAAYPVYKKVTKKQREKVLPKIIELSDELINGK
jgi:Flp pilus assembly protein TadB